MVAGELAQGFEALAEGILQFVNYGITILFIMIVIEVVKLFRGGKIEEKVKEPFSGLSDAYQKGGVKGIGKQMGRDVKKVWKGEEKAEKAELSKYIALKSLRDSVKKLDDVKNQDDLKNVIEEIRSDEKVVKRDEVRGRKRINRLRKQVNKAKLPADKKAEAEKIIEGMGALNTKVIESTVAFDNELRGNWRNFKSKKENLKRAINEMIVGEDNLMAEFKKLEKLLK